MSSGIAVAGGIAAEGARSAVHVRGDVPGLSTVSITAADGERLVQLPE